MRERVYDIPAGTLGAVIDALGRQSDVQIIYAPDRVRGKTSSGLSGSYTVRGALRRVLQGTGVTWRSLGSSAFVLVPRKHPSSGDATRASAVAGANGRRMRQKHAQELAAVIVTGSHIRRVDVETANPVHTVSHAVIAASGAMTLGGLVQRLPAMTGGAINPQDHTSSASNTFGRTRLSLRGLGPDRTLILVDGRRVLSSDISSIPAAMIDRIEVLKNGASAVYGSDAIGGVVNFITRRHFRGVQVTGRVGQSSHADARSRGYTLTFGQSTDKGSVIGGLGWSRIDGVDQIARPWSRYALELGVRPDGTVGVFRGGSSNSPYGNIQLPESGPIHDAFATCASGHVARNPGASGMDPINDYHCYHYNGPHSDKYNYNTSTELMTPQERTHAFILGTYHLRSNVSIYLDAYYTRTRAYFHQAPNTFHTPGVRISAQNYWNPFGVDFGPHGNAFRSRTVGIGDRIARNRVTNAQAAVGLKGTFSMFGNRWHWEAGLNYGHEHTHSERSGFAQRSRLYTGPSFLDPDTGEVTCGTPDHPMADCNAAFNPFNMQAPNTIAALERANVHTITTGTFEQKIWQANAEGGLLDLPAGTVQFAVGVNHRKRQYQSHVSPLYAFDPVTGTCAMGRECSSSVHGDITIQEAYGELFIPIVSRQPWAYGLNVTIGSRYSHYSSFGSTNNAELKLEWRPVRSLLVRGSVEQVFRAPNILEMFSPRSYTSPFITTDPCRGYTGKPLDPACIHVPTDGSFTNHSVRQGVETSIHEAGARASGFPIQPETGKSFDIGIVYSPDWAPGLTVSVDAWHLYLNHIITIISAQNLLNLCSDGRRAYCRFIHRFPSGPQQGQLSSKTLQPTSNMGHLGIGSIDLDSSYTVQTAQLGRFSFKLFGTYLRYYNVKTAPGVPAYHFAGQYMPEGSAQGTACPGVGQCLFPRWRANAVLMWDKGPWSALWKVRYIGDFRMGSSSPSQDTHPAGGRLDGFYIDYGATLYHDVALAYRIAPLHSRVTLGVNNLFDKQPPILYANNTDNANTDALNFDLMGRYYWLRWTVRY
ncbi:MAG TPA: TonB-dependent receptor [Oleiagrimonas sp.]|nr:TonB-dependent receptor [Oleiagrimonas sp.]